MPVYSGVPETTDAIRAAHEGVIGQILTMNLLRIQAFWSHYRFRQQNARCLTALLHQQLRMTSVISSLRRMLLNWPSRATLRTREILESAARRALASSQTPMLYSVARIIAPLAPARRSPTTGTSPSGSVCAIFVAFIWRAAAGIRRHLQNASAITDIQRTFTDIQRWLAIPIRPKPMWNGRAHLLRAGDGRRMGY